MNIAYICFHKAGGDVELPILKLLGFKIWVTKKYSSLHRSSKTYHYFDNVNIPKEKLDILNETNFIDTKKNNPEVWDILNQYFDYVFIIQNSTVVKKFLENFKGKIIVRLAGLDSPKSYTSYYNFTEPSLLKLIYINSQRIFFSIQYKNLVKIEDPIFELRSVYMPLGLPSYFKKFQNSNFTSNKSNYIISVIPDINSDYYNQIYKKVIFVLRNFNFYILGKQTDNYSDKHVTGFMEDEEYLEFFKGASVFYYYSIEPRHVHYPPIEAVILGIPVVYHKNSLFADLVRRGSKSVLFDGVDSEASAEKTIQKIISDRVYADALRLEQKKLLLEFDQEFITEQWKSAFEKICSSNDVETDISLNLRISNATNFDQNIKMMDLLFITNNLSKSSSLSLYYFLSKEDIDCDEICTIENYNLNYKKININNHKFTFFSYELNYNSSFHNKPNNGIKSDKLLYLCKFIPESLINIFNRSTALDKSGYLIHDFFKNNPNGLDMDSISGSLIINCEKSINKITLGLDRYLDESDLEWSVIININGVDMIHLKDKACKGRFNFVLEFPTNFILITFAILSNKDLRTDNTLHINEIGLFSNEN